MHSVYYLCMKRIPHVIPCGVTCSASNKKTQAPSPKAKHFEVRRTNDKNDLLIYSS